LFVLPPNNPRREPTISQRYPTGLPKKPEKDFVNAVVRDKNMSNRAPLTADEPTVISMQRLDIKSDCQ